MIVLLSISVGFMAFMIRRNFEDTQEQLINSIDENVRNYFEEMNAFSMELMNNQAFKKTAVNQLPQEYIDGKSTTESFSQLYRDAYKMFQKSYNVGIVVNGRYYIWMGRRYHIHQIDPARIHTYDTLVRDEKPVVKYLKQNDYLAFSGSEENDGESSYITLSRSMDLKNQYLNGKQILEIQVETEDFVNDMKKLSGESSTVQINIFDSDGNVLYQESQMDLTGYLKENFAESRLYSDVISVRKLFEGNLTVIYTRNFGDYLRMRLAFWALALFAGCGFIGIILWMTYRVSRQISEPISRICERVGFPESHVSIDIPLEMMATRIPKLTVQPLIENAFKYCNRNRPEIQVKGTVGENGGWRIKVSDNGAGFSHEKKEEIMRKCEEGLKNENVLSYQIDGMGLVNVYVRMQLFYGKESMLYQLEENRGSVIIGKRDSTDGISA